MATLRPISDDRGAALALARRAVRARNEPETESGPFLSAIERDVADGSALGVLRFLQGQLVGIALWEAPSEIGVTVEVLYSVEGFQTGDQYRQFYTEIRAEVGPVALAPGLLVGLDPTEEGQVMRDLGFARFSRSEMRFPTDAPLPPRSSAPGLRSFEPTDESGLARVHEAAYQAHLDRYLFFSDPDPARDAEIHVRDIVGGRWGGFLPWASFVIEVGGQVVGGSLVVRAPYGPLVADVAVYPAHQGHGLGRAVVGASVRALRERNETVIVLNVSDGNTRALRLYHRVGFVRTIGPSHGWYSTERIPVAPASR